ncbi:lanC-like protein 3 homolog [Anopheles nili]|uniref:lanC-like protein 3 homolog n=1 Tax=Anopheles nili TaxID=185578 RepID=UPI00237AD720|nr:lanC-like protein 3 homolog [Anopheles nili]
MPDERYFPNPFDDFCETNHESRVFKQQLHETAIFLIKKFVAMIESQKDSQSYREDVYVGVAGIAFMFWKLSRAEETKALYPCLEIASNYIRQAKQQCLQKNRSSKTSVAFLCGNAGIAAISAVISYDMGNDQDMKNDVEDFLKGYSCCSRPNDYDADEVLVGRAGYLHGAYWLNQIITTKPIENIVIDQLCQVLIKRGRSISSQLQLSVPLMYEYHGKTYLGAAHGICAILHALLESPWFNKTENSQFSLSPSKLSDIKNTIDYLQSLQNSNGNFPTRHDSDRFLIHWCHGCAGAIYVFAKAYLVFKSETYLQTCRKCADAIWHQGLLRKGPGICHGVAGNGYAFLLMYRLTGETCYLYRASKFAEFLNSKQFSEILLVPDRPYSLYEGLAGAVCFLVDLLNPSHASFPFMDVFECKIDKK